VDSSVQNLIVKVTESECSKILQIVQEQLQRTGKSNALWPEVWSAYSAFCWSTENTNSKKPLRHAESREQIAKIFQNRRCYGYECCKTFQKWHENLKIVLLNKKKDKLSVEVEKRLRLEESPADASPTQKPRTEQPPHSQDSQPREESSAQPREESSASTVKSFSAETSTCSQGLSLSLAAPSPSPVRPFNPTVFVEPCLVSAGALDDAVGRCDVLALHDAIKKNGLQHFLDKMGHVNWVAIKEHYPDFDLSTAGDPSGDLLREKSSAMCHTSSIRQQQLRSLKPGSTIEDFLIIPAFLQHVHHFVYVNNMNVIALII